MANTQTTASVPEIEYVDIDRLWLDPQNPRLGRSNVEKKPDQEAILDLMKDWTLDELAVSFIESGYWPQEAVIVISEWHEGELRDIVVEGNRRLAALKLLRKVWSGEPSSSKWRELAEAATAEQRGKLDQIAIIRKASREEVRAYLGFRHVTGIAEWNPAEKAQFIASLIESGLSYNEVRKQIGSTTPAVRQNYIAYRLLLQMEGEDEIDLERVERRFSVLYLSLRTRGVQEYLGLNIKAEPEDARQPVPQEHLQKLTRFASWLFGKGERPAMVPDSRNVDGFGLILESQAAVDYLERADQPNFDVAKRMSGVSETEISVHLERAADEVEEALKAVHQHKKSRRVQAAVKRLGLDAKQLLSLFPTIESDIESEDR